MRHMQQHVITIVSALMMTLASCGKPEQKVEIKTNSSNASIDPKCTRSKCDPVTFSLLNSEGGSAETTRLVGQIGVDVAWPFKLKIEGAPAKRIQVAIYQAPAWISKGSKESEPGAIVLTGTPTEVTTRGKIVILARDISRCEALETDAKSRKLCGDHKVDLSEKGYDKFVTLEYSVTPQGVDPNMNGNMNNMNGNMNNMNGNPTADPYGNSVSPIDTMGNVFRSFLLD